MARCKDVKMRQHHNDRSFTPAGVALVLPG